MGHDDDLAVDPVGPRDPANLDPRITTHPLPGLLRLVAVFG
jgi:hypothetical protein